MTTKRDVKAEEIKENERFIAGSGNVFADLGLPDAEELQFKAKLIRQVERAIKEQGLTQTKAALVTGMDQATLSKLLRGRFMSCSADRLFEMLRKLGHSVEVTVADKAVEAGRATVAVKVGGSAIRRLKHGGQGRAKQAA